MRQHFFFKFILHQLIITIILLIIFLLFSFFRNFLNKFICVFQKAKNNNFIFFHLIKSALIMIENLRHFHICHTPNIFTGIKNFHRSLITAKADYVSLLHKAHMINSRLIQTSQLRPLITLNIKSFTNIQLNFFFIFKELLSTNFVNIMIYYSHRKAERALMHVTLARYSFTL